MSEKEKGVNFEGLKRYDERLKEASNILQRNCEYQIDDIVHYKQYCLKCVKAGTTSTGNVDFSTNVIIDGTVVWEKYKQKTVYYMNQPVGHIEYAYDVMEGYLVFDGSTYNRAEYPELIEWITNKNLWTENSEYGKFGVGDGTTTFVMPNFLARFVEGSLESGTTKEAGLPNIEGSLSTSDRRGWGFASLGTGTGIGAISPDNSYEVSNAGSGVGSSYLGGFSFDASRSSAIYGNSDTVQPKSVTLIPQIKYCNDTYINYIEEHWSDFEDIYYKNSFTIIYPNGGTEANPANISINSRYVETNPFAGYRVFCDVELYYNNQWGSTELNTYSNNGFGVYVGQHNDNSIVIQTGNNSLLGTSSIISNTFGVSTSINTPLPCRVKVWKIGKIEE